MRKHVILLAALALSALLAFGCGGGDGDEKVVKIGFNIPLTGDIPKVGESSKNAAEMLKKRINDAGGLRVGEEMLPLEFVYEDNESKAESAVSAALKLIEQDRVLGLIGPQSSKQAIPAGEVADANMTPMISPWSTNPTTTKNRPYVFRACFLDPFQGPVAAKFATEEFGADKAAVLYDIASDYPKGLAEFFTKAFEEIHGKGSVVASETFTTKDQDFSAQLTNIVNSDADVLFLPQYYSEVALIAKQAHDLGWDKPILGSDSWGSAELMNLCGDDCKGQFFTTHYAAAGATGKTKEFIEDYEAAYGETPDDVAALTWDAIHIMLDAVQRAGLNGELEQRREEVMTALGGMASFEGITGTMSFNEDGDPVKCAVVVKINDQGEFTFYKSVCP
ncbi:ABC transporter substrate-binding protein [Desulfohalovibrio reitneri]|uniref:ABC transporter substrate-binding protein n=1 Tax=Desulfohalovibrio reitneri TaxID=1307759 RepID=UPI0004A75FCB|nr:ABC transporter substrate-binding protein [Desulfohalovibrio reitneri]